MTTWCRRQHNVAVPMPSRHGGSHRFSTETGAPHRGYPAGGAGSFQKSHWRLEYVGYSPNGQFTPQLRSMSV
jgi:hypothetical protein